MEKKAEVSSSSSSSSLVPLNATPNPDEDDAASAPLHAVACPACSSPPSKTAALPKSHNEEATALGVQAQVAWRFSPPSSAGKPPKNVEEDAPRWHTCNCLSRRHQQSEWTPGGTARALSDALNKRFHNSRGKDAAIFRITSCCSEDDETEDSGFSSSSSSDESDDESYARPTVKVFRVNGNSFKENARRPASKKSMTPRLQQPAPHREPPSRWGTVGPLAHLSVHHHPHLLHAPPCLPPRQSLHLRRNTACPPEKCLLSFEQRSQPPRGRQKRLHFPLHRIAPLCRRKKLLEADPCSVL